jgi:transposase
VEATIVSKTANEWLAILVQAGSLKTDEVPQDWESCRTIAKKTGRSESQTRRLLSAALEEGSIEQRKYRIKTGHKATYLVPHYRIVK